MEIIKMTQDNIDSLIRKRIEQLSYNGDGLTMHEERMLKMRLRKYFERLLSKNESYYYILKNENNVYSIIIVPYQ